MNHIIIDEIRYLIGEQTMENTATHFECEIENLYYITIERDIAHYFNMGSPDNSNIPPQMQENVSDECILVCTKKSGTFELCNRKLTNSKYLLSVSLKGKLHEV